MVKRPKKFVTVDDSSPTVARANSQRQGRASYSSIRRNIRSLLHLTALPILPDERLVIRLFCAVSLLANSCELTLSLEDIFSMLIGLQYFLCHDYRLEYKHEFLKLQLSFATLGGHFCTLNQPADF